MLLAALALSLTPALPQDEAELEYQAFLQEFVADLDFQEGQVTVHGGDVIFDLPEGWALLEGRDARAVVEDLWGNPEDPSTVAFIDPPSPDGRLNSVYGIIVTVDESGYVKDEDSQNIDYGDLLKTIQKDAQEVNEYRAANGFEPVEIVGWAEPPHYDMREKKLYWAKELKFGDDPEHTLNYDVRVLGRKGYVMLQAVAPIGALAEVDAGMKTILDSTDFAEGMRYFDFDSSVDKVAVYGIGGLIAGKALAKVGAFAVLAKFGKFIVLGVIGAFVALKKFVFGRGSQEVYEEEPAAEEPA